MDLHKQIEKIKQEALTLRNVADRLLVEVKQLEQLLASPVPKQKKNAQEEQAALRARILSGQVKPNRKK